MKPHVRRGEVKANPDRDGDRDWSLQANQLPGLLDVFEQSNRICRAGWHHNVETLRLLITDRTDIVFRGPRIGVRCVYPSVAVFRRRKYSDGDHISAYNSVRWHLATNSFHQHVRLLMEISPHTFFWKIFRSGGGMCVSMAPFWELFFD